MSEFVVSVRAKQDLKEFAAFTQTEWGRDQRNNYLIQFDQTFHLLANKSNIGKSCDEIKEGYLKFRHASHVIFYIKIDATQILIVRILHKRMDHNPNLNG